VSRCLITGATGFIGGHLTERLAGDGRQVRCLVRSTSDTTLLEPLGVELVVGDMTDPASLNAAAAGCESVFHCAALVSDWATAREIARINVSGTRDLLEASVAAGVQRFIHFSTTDVYGYPGGSAVDETYTTTRFRNWYAQTKREAEEQVQRVEQTHAIETVILRPATVYGPRSVEVIGEIAKAICNGTMLLIDKGRAVAGLCYVENLIDAAVLASSSAAAPGQAFNVCDGIDITWQRFTGDLADGLGCSRVRFSMPYWMATGIAFSLESAYRLLRATLGLRTPPLLSRQAVHILAVDQEFSNRRAREILGWIPRVDYATGLRETIEWLRADFGLGVL
jgi:nucleoside-diphosphate-sugar epimerase